MTVGSDMKLVASAGMVAMVAAATPSMHPAGSGTARYLPSDLLTANFTSLGAVAAAAGTLRLAGTGSSEAPPAGILSNSRGLPGDVVVDVHIASIMRHPQSPGYESIPLAVLATTGYNLSTNTGPRAQQSLKLHSTIDETWMELSTYTNSSKTASGAISWQKQPAYTNATVRIMRRGGLLWGGLLLPGDTGLSWWGAGTNYGSSTPPGHVEWLSAPPGPLQVGVVIDADYAPSYTVDVSALDVWADSDEDGVADLEELKLGTSPTNPDSDNDGVDDWLDIRPRDPEVGAIAFDSFTNASSSAKLDFKLTGAQGAAILIVNNTANVGLSPGKMHFPGLAASNDCVTVDGEARKLSCQEGYITDDKPLLPWGRRAYTFPTSWDAVIADSEGLTFSASASASRRVDLRQHIASVLPLQKVSAFSVISVTSTVPGLFTATMESDKHTLALSTPDGPACGTANVTIHAELRDAPSGSGSSTSTSSTSATVSLSVRKAGAVGPPLLANGNFSGNITSTRFGPQMSGWRTNTWSGLFTLNVCPLGTAFAAPHCIMLQGFGAGKFGVYQTVSLQAGTYVLSALMASVELEPGQWSGTTSIYATFSGAARPDFPQLATGPGSTHDLLHSSSGWRKMNATFSTPVSTSMTLYFFIWGSGRFFLEDVSLVQLQCQPSAPDSLTLSTEDLAPLAYNVPLTFEDTLMCGYCNDSAHPAFNETELCTKCATTNLTAMQPDRQAEEDKVLTEWSSSGTSFFAPDPSMWTENANGTATLFPGKYVSSASISADNPVDWSEWSFLQMTTYNPSATAQPFSVEIRDTATVDYWSRVNWVSVVAPGTSTFLMPISVYVGEKSEVKVRRMIDLHAVTRLAIANNGIVNVTIGTIKLLPQVPFQHDFPQLLKIDVQPRTGPVLKAFTGLYPDTLDESRRGYGILNTSKQGAVAQDREHPDDLMRDWVSFVSGGLNFHLPQGKYGVWFIMEDAGYWEYYQNYKARSVVVSGGACVNQTMDVGEFWKRYYAHSDVEDLPGESSWHRYVKPRYLDRAHFLEATVEAGSPLTIRFDSEDAFACTLSALLIWPLEMNASATSFLEELQGRLLAQYQMEYMQSLPSPRGSPVRRAPSGVTPTSSLEDRLVFFSPNITEQIDANGNPEPNEVIELKHGGGLNLTVAAAGEAAAYVCFVDPDANVHGPVPPLTRATVSGLDSTGLTGKLWVVRYKQKRLTMDGAVWANKPRLLVDYWTSAEGAPQRSPLEVNNVTRCLWLEVAGPSTVTSVPAVHSAEVELVFDQTDTVKIPLTVKELAAALPTVGPLWVGYMGMLPTYPGTDWPEVREKQLAELEPSLRTMQRLGFSAATGGAGGPNVANESLADLSFETHQRVFGASVPVNSYMGSAVVGLNVRDGRSPGFAADVKAILTNVSAHANVAGWPDFIQTCGDEPQGDAVDGSLAVGQAFAEARSSLASTKVGRTSVFTSVLNVTSDYTAKLLAKNSSIDYIVINEHSAKAIKLLIANGHQWMLYNGGSRFRVGFYLAMASHGYGCHGLYDFAFSSVHADPYYALDSREDDLCAAFTSPPVDITRNGAASPLVLLLNTVQTMREGLNDLRFTKLLRTLLSSSRWHSTSKHESTIPAAMRSAVARGSAVLAEIDSIPLGSDQPQWEAGRILRVRSEVEAAVEALLLQLTS